MSLGTPKFQGKRPRNRGNFLTKKRLHGGTPKETVFAQSEFERSQGEGRTKPISKRTYINSIFTGLSQDCPGTVPAFSWVLVLWIWFMSPCPSRKDPPKQLFSPPSVPGTILTGSCVYCLSFPDWKRERDRQPCEIVNGVMALWQIFRMATVLSSANFWNKGCVFKGAL